MVKVHREFFTRSLINSTLYVSRCFLKLFSLEVYTISWVLVSISILLLFPVTSLATLLVVSLNSYLCVTFVSLLTLQSETV